MPSSVCTRIDEDKKTPQRLPSGASVVPVAGVEPARTCVHGILSPGRLPIPPHRLIVDAFDFYFEYYIITTAKMQ